MPPGLISHEFRTPLAAVVGLIRVLDRAFERLDESTRRDVIMDLVRDSSRPNNLIENMLLFAQAGSIEHVQEPMSLHRILPAVVRRARDRDPPRTLLRELPDDVTVVLGHAGP